MIEVRERARRQRRRADGGAAGADPPLRLRRRRGATGDGRTSCGSPAWSRSRPGRGAEQPGRHRPLRARPVDLRRACANTPPGRGGEIQLTDALQERAGARTTGGGVHGVVFRGRRYDTGDRLDYLKAVVRLASERPDLGAGLLRVARRLRRRRAEQPPRRDHGRAAPRPHPRHRRGRCRPRARACSTRQGCVLAADVRQRASTCPASTTPPWTATPCAPPTWPAPREDRAGRPAGRRRHRRGQHQGARPGAGADDADHDRRADAARGRRRRAGRGDRRRAWSRVAGPAPAVAPGQHVRAPARTSRAGDVVLRRRHAARARPDRAAGRGRRRAGCAVRPKPRVVVLSTGDELVEPATGRASARSSTATARCSPPPCATLGRRAPTASASCRTTRAR